MNVLVYDNRLEGSVPKFDGQVVEVGKHVNLHELVSRLLVIAEANSKISALHIMAHGIEEEEVSGPILETGKATPGGLVRMEAESRHDDLLTI